MWLFKKVFWDPWEYIYFFMFMLQSEYVLRPWAHRRKCIFLGLERKWFPAERETLGISCTEHVPTLPVKLKKFAYVGWHILTRHCLLGSLRWMGSIVLVYMYMQGDIRIFTSGISCCVRIGTTWTSLLNAMLHGLWPGMGLARHYLNCGHASKRQPNGRGWVFNSLCSGLVWTMLGDWFR